MKKYSNCVVSLNKGRLEFQKPVANLYILKQNNCRYSQYQHYDKFNRI